MSSRDFIQVDKTFAVMIKPNATLYNAGQDMLWHSKEGFSGLHAVDDLLATLLTSLLEVFLSNKVRGVHL